MKRFFAVLSALLLAVCLSPDARAASESLARPEAGQIISIPAQKGTHYAAAFYLSAVDELRRDGDALCILFPAARITLKDFFSSDGQRLCLLSFAGGEQISAADFDEDGRFTGRYCSGESYSKADAAAKDGLEDGSENLLTVCKSRSGLQIDCGGTAVYGALRANAVGLLDTYLALGGADWNKNESITLMLVRDAQENVTAEKETLVSLNGVTVHNLRPAVIYLPDSETLIALSAGRASLRFQNALGDTLQTLQVQVTEEGGSLVLACECPACGGNQAAALHFLPCGHYRCAGGFDESGHAVPACGIAGHCATDGAAHGNCENCLQPLCDGQTHGWGLCPHAHSWVPQSYTAPTATSTGQSVSRCKTCGITYTQTLPMRPA